MPNCPKCGGEVREDATFCPNCGNKLKPESGEPGAAPVERKRSYTEHLTIGFNVATQNPMVFVPSILAGLVSSGISWLGLGLPDLMPLLLALVASIVSFLLSFASLDMSRDAYNKQPLDLGGSVGYVAGRIVEFFVAAVVGGIMAVTIFLIPVVTLMFTIMVIDETGLSSAISKAFSVLGAELKDVVLILLVSIAGAIAISFVPLVGGLLSSALNVVVGLAFIDLYYNYKGSA
jgi:hypothetical protein